MHHLLSIHCWTTIIVVSLLLAAPPTTTAQSCELCGCSFCPPGEFPVGNLDAPFPVPEGQLSPDLAHLEVLLAQLEASAIVLNCAFVASALAQLYPPEQCIALEELRLLPEIREVCGCPPLPPTVSPRPTATPTAAPTAAPVGFFREMFQRWMSALISFLDFIRGVF